MHSPDWQEGCILESSTACSGALEVLKELVLKFGASRDRVLLLEFEIKQIWCLPPSSWLCRKSSWQHWQQPSEWHGASQLHFFCTSSNKLPTGVNASDTAVNSTCLLVTDMKQWSRASYCHRSGWLSLRWLIVRPQMVNITGMWSSLLSVLASCNL